MVETPAQGICRGRASPLTTESPMRSPVKLPGPLVTPSRSMSSIVSPQARSAVSIMGSRVSLWVMPLLHWVSYSRVSSRKMATAADLPAVSTARIFIQSPIRYVIKSIKSTNRNLTCRLVHPVDVDMDGLLLLQQVGAVLAPLAGNHRAHVQIVVEPGGGKVVLGVDAV